MRDNLAQWLREFHARFNITSIFVTHDQNEAIEISDKIVLINRGRVEQYGSARDVYEYPQSRFVASFIGQVNVIDGRARGESVYIENTDYSIKRIAEETLADGDTVLLVRPEDVEVRPDASESALPFKITAIHYRGSHYDIDCALGKAIVRARENKVRFLSYRWHEGQEVFIAFKSYRIFEAEEGHAKLRQKLKDLGYLE